MAGLPVGWHPDPDNAARRRYWDGHRWGPSVSVGEAERRRREVRHQGILVVGLMVVIAVAWLLYGRPWVSHKPHHVAPTPGVVSPVPRR